MLTAARIQHMLSQIINVFRKKYLFDESISCTLRLFLFKRLLDRSIQDKSKELYIPTDLTWSSIEDEQHYLGEKIKDSFKKLRDANPKLENSLQEVFDSPPGTFWIGFDDESLRYAVQTLAKLEISNENLEQLDEAWEWFIEHKVARRNIQGAYTPRQLSQLMVKLISPGKNSNIYDPACGSGELLAECTRFIRNNGEDISNINVFGKSTHVQEYWIAKSNLIFQGINDPNIRLGDLIFEPCFFENGKPRLFDFILTNPPFNLKYSSESLRKLDYPKHFPYGVPENGTANFLFIQHVLSSLKDAGKAAVILPRGVLFSQDEEIIRKKIVEDDLIEAVIELAPKLFYGTSIPVVVIVFNRNKLNKNEVLFIDASSKYESERGQNFLHNDHINHIVNAHKKFKSEGAFAKVSSTEEIAQNQYNLSVSQYILHERNKPIDIASEIKKLYTLETERSELEATIDNCLRKLKIKL